MALSLTLENVVNFNDEEIILYKSNEHQMLVKEEFDIENDETKPIISRDKSNGFLNKLALFKGIFYTTLSSLCFSLCSAIVKYLENIHPGELAMVRYCAIFILSVPFVMRLKDNAFGPKESRHLLIIRGIAGASALFLRFMAFRYLPIADASVIVFSFPVFVMIFAKIFLNESCAVIKIFTLVLSMIGLIFTAKLPILFNNNNIVNNTSSYNTTDEIINYSSLDSSKINHIYGTSAAFASTLLMAAAYIAISKMKNVHHMVIMFNFGWIAIIETTIITGALRAFSLPQNFTQWMLLIVLGLLSFTGQTLLTRSLQLDQSGPVSVVRSGTDIVFAFIWQIIFFHEMPDVWSICGAILVTSGVIIIGVRAWVLSLPIESPLKHKFRFMLL